MTNASSALNAAGNSFEQSVALLTAANTTIQNAAKSSTGLRTIAARIRNTKAELDDLGEVMTSANYEELVSILTDEQVKLRDINGEYRSTYDILADIAAKWNEMGSDRQAALATALSGTRQQAVFYSIIDNFQEASKAMDAMNNSAGELQKSFNTFLTSSQAHINKFKNTFAELSSNIMATDTINFVVDLGNLILKIVNAVFKLVNAVGGLKTVLIATAGIIATIKVEAIASAISKIPGIIAGIIPKIVEMISLLGALNAVEKSVLGVTAAITALGVAVSLVRMNEQKRHDKLQSDYEDRLVAKGEAEDLHGLISEYNKASDAYNKGVASKEALEAATRNLADALGLEGDAAEATAERIERLSKAEMLKKQADVQSSLYSAQSKLVERYRSMSNWHPILSYTFGEYGTGILGQKSAEDPFGLLNYPDVESQANALVKVYQKLIEERDKLLSEGKQGSSRYNRIVDTIGFLSGDVEDIIKSKDALRIVSEYISDIENPKQAIEASRNVDALVKTLTKNPPHASGVGEYVRYIREQLEGLSDEDYEVAEYLISKGVVSRFEQLPEAIDRARKSFNLLTSLKTQDKLKDIISSDDFKEAREELEALSQTSEGITAQKIEEVASSSKELASLLEIDGINARFLAKILETEFRYGAGSGISLITEDALTLSQALEGMEREFSRVSEAKAKYDAAMSVPEKDTDFKSMAGAFKVLNDQFVAGTTNSRAFWAAAEYIFGADQLEKWNWDLQTIYDSAKKNVGVFKDAESAGQGFLDRLEEIADENGNVIDEDGTIIASLTKLSDGTYDLDIDALNLDALAEKMGMSEEAILSCLEALSMFGEIDFYDIKDVLQAVKDIGLSSDAFNGTAVNAGALKDRLVSLGYTDTEIRKIIRSLNELDGVTLVDVNSSVDDIAKSLSELGAASQSGGKTIVDIEGVADLASQLGMTKDEASGLITKLYEADGITLSTAEGEVKSLDDALAALDGKQFSSVTSEIDSITASANTANSAVETLRTSIANLDGVNATATITTVHRDIYTGSGVEGGESGTTISEQKYAGGTKNARGGFALTGEDGPELYTHRGAAYIAGTNGPEIVRLDDGDKVYTAGETRRILGSAYHFNGSIPAFSGGSKGRATGNFGITKWEDLFGGSAGSGGSGSGGSGSGGPGKSSSSSDKDNWFIRQYKLNNHLITMCQEDMADYLDWLAWAFPKAYEEGLFELDEYRKYQEELFKGLQNLFKDYLSDIEHEIDMRGNFDREEKAIVALYNQMMSSIKDEIDAARAQGLDDNDDYIQALQQKYMSYADAIQDLEDDISDGAKDAVDKLVEYRQKMLRQEISDKKDAYKKQLDALKDFYDKQKEMLKDARDEEKYLDEQSEKRKSVTDIQAQLAQLEYDNSAWAQKRKAELRKQLSDAQKELADFEKDHALDSALDFLDDSYESQESQINLEIEKLDNLLNDPEAIYNRALADIRGDTSKLYEAMVAYNRAHGTGNDADVFDIYDDAFAALSRYKDYYGDWYDDVDLWNATGYAPKPGSWNTEYISGYANPTVVEKQKPEKKGGSTQPPATTQPSPGGGSKTKTKTDTARLDEERKEKDAIVSIKKAVDEVAKKALALSTLPLQVPITPLKTPDLYGGLRLMRNAAGTENAKPGVSLVDEVGAEWLFTSQSGDRYRVFSGGEKVLNAKATNFLYEFANNGAVMLKSIISKLTDNGSVRRVQPMVSNSDISLGDIIIQGSATSATVSEIRRAQREQLTNVLKEFNRLNGK